MLKPRDFQLDAWELCRQFGAPGDVPVIKKAMEFGYALGIKDATERLAELTKQTKEERERSSRPR